MVQALEPSTRPRGGPGPAAQPRGRGVAARRDAALARRDQRGHRGRRRGRPTSTSRRTRTSSRPSSRSTGRASRSTRSPSPTSCGAPTCSTSSAAARRCCGSRRRRRRRRTRRTTRTSSTSSRCCGGSSRSPARSPRWATTTPARSPRRSTAPRRSCSRSPSGASSDSMTGVSDALQDTLDQLEALYGSDGEITGVADRLRRPRQPAPRPPAVEPRRRRGTAGRGEVRRLGHADRRPAHGRRADGSRDAPARHRGRPTSPCSSLGDDWHCARPPLSVRRRRDQAGLPGAHPHRSRDPHDELAPVPHSRGLEAARRDRGRHACRSAANPPDLRHRGPSRGGGVPARGRRGRRAGGVPPAPVPARDVPASLARGRRDRGARARIEYRCESEQLARDVCHLLLRFGIITRVRRGSVGSVVTVHHAGSVLRFCSEIGIDGQREALVETRAEAERRIRNPTLDTLPVEICDAHPRCSGAPNGGSVDARSRNRHVARADRGTVALLADVVGSAGARRHGEVGCLLGRGRRDRRRRGRPGLRPHRPRGCTTSSPGTCSCTTPRSRSAPPPTSR